MMHNKKSLLLLLLSTAAMSGRVISAHGANWNVVPSLTFNETYTDNVDLDSSVRRSDFVTQIGPKVQITGEGARLKASLLYAPNYFYYPAGHDKHEFRQNLQANLSSEVIRDTFFIDASAGINQRFLDRRQAISTERVSRTSNRQTIQTYQFSPYARHRFGSWATAELRYNLSYVRRARGALQTTPNTVFGNSLTHLGSFSVSSGPQFQRLTWTMSALYQKEKRENLSNYKTTTARADFSYQLSTMFSALGSAGYQKRDAIGSFANFKGFIWDAGFRFVPGPRTSVSFRYGNQFDGNTFSLDALYKITSKNNISLTYSDKIQTFQSLALDSNSTTNLGTSLGGNFISGDLTRRKQWNFTVSGTRGRTTYGASAFYSKFISDKVVLNEKRYGGSVTIARNLNSKLSINGGFSYNLSKFLSDNVNDKFWSASANVNYKISKSLIGTIGYVHSNRDQRRFGLLNGGSNYVSLSISAAL